MEGNQRADEPPAKRRRLSSDESYSGHNVSVLKPGSDGEARNTDLVGTPTAVMDQQLEREIKAGITAFVNPESPGFSGVLKHRYTDFLVNEILPDGTVLHLRNLTPPNRDRSTTEKEATAVLSTTISNEDVQTQASDTNDPGRPIQISAGDSEQLVNVFGKETVGRIISLYEAVFKHPSRKPKDFQPVNSAPIKDKEIRTEAHQAIRRIFHSTLESKTNSADDILITAAPAAPERRGGGRNGGDSGHRNKLGWQDLGGEYVHFTLLKENKDTMEAVSFLSSQLKVNVKHFQFGGTKDRRAVTVQRCSAYRIYAEQLQNVGRRLHGSAVGDFEYRHAGLELGDLGGNEFTITLRDCHFVGEDGLVLDERVELGKRTLTSSIEAFTSGGFINYYGLQRFGSFLTSTDSVGIKLLQNNLSGAVEDILSYNPSAISDKTILVSTDDRARAEAIRDWNANHNSATALQKLPRKFSAEANIIRHLGLRHKKTGSLANLNDYQGALQSIARNLRLMYVHAYQSLVWNVVVGRRWALYGSNVVEGDLVLISEHREKESTNIVQEPAVDDQGEPVVLPHSRLGITSSAGKGEFERARALSASEAASGRYSIFDIVLPLPGYDVLYPPNLVGNEYKTFMASERGGGLDPYDMRRAWKDLSLSGSYRKILARPDPSIAFEVRKYERPEDQLVQTDLQKLESSGKPDGSHHPPKAGHSRSDNVDNREAGQQSGIVNSEKKIAVVLKLRLGPSQYATMALRELMKTGGVKAFKPDYGSGG